MNQSRTLLIAITSIMFIALAVVLHGALPGLGLSVGLTPDAGGGLLAILICAGQTLMFVAVSLASALAINALATVAVLASERWAQVLLVAAIFFSALPLFALIPLWLFVSGDGWPAGYAFLTFAILVYLVMTAGQTVDASRRLRQLMAIVRPNLRTRLVVVSELLWWSSRGRLLTTAAFALPFSVGGELIAGRGGLGLLATNAYRNGNFAQLTLVAASYALLSLLIIGPRAYAAPSERRN